MKNRLLKRGKKNSRTGEDGMDDPEEYLAPKGVVTNCTKKIYVQYIPVL